MFARKQLCFHTTDSIKIGDSFLGYNGIPYMSIVLGILYCFVRIYVGDDVMRQAVKLYRILAIDVVYL